MARLGGAGSLDASGAATAEIHLHNTYGNPLGSALVQVNDGSVSQQDFSKLYAKIDLTDQLVTLSQLEADTAGGAVRAHGAYHHPRESFASGQAQVQIEASGIQLAKVQAIAKQNAGVAGTVNLNASSSLNVRDQPNQPAIGVTSINADLSARALRVQNQDAGEITATARSNNGQVRYKLDSNFAGSTIDVHGNTSLSSDYLTRASATIRDLSVGKALQLAGQASIPATGSFSADARVDGTVIAPDASLNFKLSRAKLYSEPVNSLDGRVQYTGTSLSIPSINLSVPAGTISLTGSYNHPVNVLTRGAVMIKVKSSDLQLAQIHNLQEQKPGLAGIFRMGADLSANIRQNDGKTKVLISNLNAMPPPRV